MLSPNLASRIVLSMELADFLQKHPEVAEINDEIRQKTTELRGFMDQLMDRLTDEEKDQLLEEFVPI